MIQFTCPCGKALHARDEYAGQTTRCPDCGREIAIPGEQGVQASPPAPRDWPDDEPRGERDRLPRRGRADPPHGPTTSGMAVTSLILGLASVFLCSVFTGLPAILLGALGLRAIGRSNGLLQGKGLAITGLVTGGISILLLPVVAMLLVMPAFQKVREAQFRQASSNNLKEMVLAMQSYHDANGYLPAAAICDPSGKPLLSWRVSILPYIEQGNLYKQFHLDEPWDSPNNLPLLARMPKEYQLPGATAPPGFTYYRVFVGKDTAFPPPQPGRPFGLTPGRRLTEITDGTSNTILIVEAATAVEWTKPDDLPYDPNALLPPLGGHTSSGFNAAMADGSIHWVSSGVSQTTLRSAIQCNDGMVLGPDW